MHKKTEISEINYSGTLINGHFSTMVTFFPQQMSHTGIVFLPDCTTDSESYIAIRDGDGPQKI